MWLFDFSEPQVNTKGGAAPNKPISIIIQNINCVNLLLETLDSIKDNYLSNSIDLILVNDTDNDLDEILQFYKTIFKGITTINKRRLDELDVDFNKSDSNYILSINSGMVLSDRFIKKIAIYIESHDFSIIFFPIYNNYENKRYIFHQLFYSFWQVCKCSLINKNLYSINDVDSSGFLIKKELFVALSDNFDKDKIHQKFIMDSDLLIYDNNTKVNLDINYSSIIYIVLNFIYFVVIAQFLASPSPLYLLIIIIKILPELYYKYAYYNRLRIKFPKIEFLVYSFFSPIYLAMILLSNFKLNRMNSDRGVFR